MPTIIKGSPNEMSSIAGRSDLHSEGVSVSEINLAQLGLDAARRLALKNPQKGLPLVASYADELASLLVDDAQVEKAESLLREALVLYKESGNQKKVADDACSIANPILARGDMGGIKDLHAKAFSIYGGLAETDSSVKAIFVTKFNNLGILFKNGRDDVEGAETFYPMRFLIGISYAHYTPSSDGLSGMAQEESDNALSLRLAQGLAKIYDKNRILFDQFSKANDLLITSRVRRSCWTSIATAGELHLLELLHEDEC